MLVGREEPRPGASDNPFDLRGRWHQGRITNSKDPDIAYLEARRRPARVEERIKEAKECGLTNFPHSSFQANRGRLLPVEMAQVLLAWARRRWCPGEFLAAAPERSRYQLRHGAGRLVRSGRLTTLGLDAKSPWAPELAAACGHRRSLPLTSDLLITPAAHLGESWVSMPSARLSTAAGTAAARLLRTRPTGRGGCRLSPTGISDPPSRARRSLTRTPTPLKMNF